MRILEYGTPGSPVLVLIHGFEMPWQLLFPCINRYKDQYRILVPVLPGHDVKEPSEFVSFEACAAELEEFCRAQGIGRLAAVCGLSMGGVLACRLWLNGVLPIDRLILESSPVLPFPAFLTGRLTSQYLSLTQRARQRDPRVLHKAAGTMVPADQLDVLLSLLDQITDSTVKACLEQAWAFSLPEEPADSRTKLVYFYGGKAAELPFRKIAKFLREHYPNAETVCLKGKGHCEDALLWPERWLKQLSPYL